MKQRTDITIHDDFKNLPRDFFISLLDTKTFLSKNTHRVHIIKESRVRCVMEYQWDDRTAFIIKKYIPRTHYDRIKSLFLISKAEREYQAALKLRGWKIPVIQPVARVEQWGRWGIDEAIFVSKKVENVISVADFCVKMRIRHPGDRSQEVLFKSLGRLAATLHRHQVYHSDFHMGNILMSGENAQSMLFYVLDLQRVRCVRSLSQKQRLTDLAYLISAFTVDQAQTIIHAYRECLPESSVIFKNISFDDIWHHKVRILTRKEHKHFSQAMHPKGGDVCERWGYRIILRWRYERFYLNDDTFQPERVAREEAARCIKRSRTSAVYQLQLPAGGGTFYYKVDHRRGRWDYFKNIFRASRSVRAWRAMNRLAIIGFRVPELLMCGEKRRYGLWQGSFLISRDVAGAKSLDAYFYEAVQKRQMPPARKRELIHALAVLVRKLHSLKIYHADLKAANILVVSSEEGFQFYIIDADRVYFKRSLRQRHIIKNLAQINASFLSGISIRDQLHFYRVYTSRASSGKHKNLIRAVDRVTRQRWKEGQQPNPSYL